MFKDYKKYLSTSVKVYLLVLLIIFILKLIGLDYFGLDINNKIICYIGNLINNNLIANNIIYMIPLLINQYVIMSITNKENSKNIKTYNLLLTPVYYVFEATKLILFKQFSFLVEIIYYFLVSILYKRKVNKEIVKRFSIIVGFMIIVQLISILTRTNTSIEYIQNPVLNLLLNFDYILLLLIVHKLYFMKGDGKVCGYQVVQHFSLQRKRVFSDLLEKLQKNYSNFKKSNKQEKATIIIYSILSFIWNMFTLIVVLFIAKINNTLVECIFIISGFWISKRVFGKPFHLESMIRCFILSNATYYFLNRITTPIGISIVVPIMLGVGLSYVTSKFVKKRYLPLFKGMSKDEFEETILKVVPKDSDKYKICYDFFIKKENAIYLGHKYNYTEAGIRKITARVNDKIKALK